MLCLHPFLGVVVDLITDYFSKRYESKRKKDLRGNMMKKKLPRFKDEDQEREFWSSHDSTEYIDWDSAEELILPNLKPSLKTISLRLPEHLLNELKFLANKKDVPYQSLLKMFLAERVQAEIRKLSHNSLKFKEKMAQQ